MFLTKEQAHVRLNSEKNLANRFGNKSFGSEIESERAINSASEAPSDQSSVSEPLQVPEVIPQQVTHKVREKKIKSVGKNRINLTRDARTEIAIRVGTGESQSSVARDLGIGQPAISNIINGKTKGVDEKAASDSISEVKDLALSRLMTSLGLITDDKLSGCSAKDLSIIASNMGKVVEKTSPKEQGKDGITFVIYAPELKQERAYDSIEI